MYSSMFFQISALFYCVLIMITYFHKKRIKSIENKLFSSLIITNFIGIIIDLISTYLAISKIQNIFLVLSSKLYLVYLITWITIMTLYIFTISQKSKNNKLKTIFKCFIAFLIISSILILVLPLYNNMESNRVYTYGPSATITYIISGVHVICWVIVMIPNIKNLKQKKYLPMFFYMTIGLALTFLQASVPEMLVITAMETFVTSLMYFTIENPDMKMLREIQQSKEFAEQANNEKAMFLYNTSQELKSPVNAIHERCEELLQEQDINEIINGIKDIKFAAKKLSTTISGTLDMNRTLTSNIEIKVSKYSTKMLFQEIVSISKLNMKDKSLDFRVKLDDAIPEYLMGDAIRLKQVIITIMNNAIKHTEKGFIEFNVSSVIKHDVCRLIMTIEDSGAGIESKKLENLFYNTEDEGIDEDNLNNMQDTKERLSVVKILTNLIGGTVIVNSELGKGSKFTVVLDQKIAEVKKSLAEIAVESLSSNKRILVVDDEEENLKQITKLLSKYEVNVETVEWGQECLEKIRKKQKYDLILLDEDMPRLNGIKTFEKLKLEEEFNIPVVIMITNNHLEYKERYLYNGFSGCVVKPLNKTQIEKLIKKYIKED